MTTVQAAQAAARATRRWWSYAALDPEVKETVGPILPGDEVDTKTMSLTDTVDCGVRYQKCGGGRRVIRRKKGGD
jgi:hypothetical protein